MKILTILLEFVIYVLLIALLAAPLALIIICPDQAEHFTDFGKTMIPWGVVLILCAIFSDGVKSLVSKLVHTLGRIKSVSAGGAAVELHQQDNSAIPLTAEQAQTLAAHVKELSSQKEGATTIAHHFFRKFVISTIYGSQFRFLETLQQGPLTPNQAVAYYNRFVAIVPNDIDYPYDRWIGYLTDNFLIQFDTTKAVFTSTAATNELINQAHAANLSAESFPY